MRRLFGFMLAGAMMVLPAFSQGHGGAYAQDAAAQSAPAAPALTFDGDIALWSVAIQPNRTADFEQVMTRVKEALMKSDQPQRQQMARGWKVVRNAMPMQDGNIVYTHVIDPVVPGADYTILTILYDAFPDPEQQRQLYELYRGAFAANLGASVGSVAVDLSAP